MVFQYGSLIFRPQDPLGDPRIRIWVPAGLGTLFGQKWGPEKHYFVEEMVSHEVLWESVRGDWVLWWPGGLWATPFPPKPHQTIIFPTFPNFRESSGAPPALHGACLLSLCGPMALFWPVWGPAAVIDFPLVSVGVP
jgi:hypothetical protein